MKMAGFMFAFIILLLAAYLSLHVAFYLLVIKVFGVYKFSYAKTLLFMILFLASSFVVGLLISHVLNNIVARTFYFISSTWVGLLIYLSLFLLLAVIINWGAAFFGIKTSLQVLGIIGIFCAVTYSGYGIYNALNPQIVSVDVSMKNLPENWKGKKIVEISDVHLGFIFRQDFLAKTVKRINALNPEIVVIVGDLFDGSNINLDMLNGYLNEIKAPSGVFFVTGNHETYVGLPKVFKALDGTGIRILKDEMVDLDGLQLIGIDYPLPGEKKDVGNIIKNLATFDAKKPSVLLLHEPVQVDQIKKTGISLQLSGHTHKAQLFPFGIITDIMYKGYDYGLKKEGDFSIYTSSGVGSWGPPMKTSARSEIVEINLK